MKARLPLPITKEMFGALLDDLPEDVFGPEFADACQGLDRFVGSLACELACRLALPRGVPLVVAALVQERGWVPGSEATLRWLLSTLELYGRAQRRGEAWVVADLTSQASAAQLQAAALAANPAVAPAYQVLSLAAAALPAVLEGTLRGEEALFGPQTMGVWFSYFSNDNPLYAPANRVTAVAAVRAAGPSPRILELGGGGGSAAQEIGRRLVAAGKVPWLYHFTDLQPAFLRRGARVAQAALPPATAFRAFFYDINQPPCNQDVTPRQYDLIVAVNTVHLARDLTLTLTMLRSLLAEGGALVLGELVRPASTGAVHLELPFSLLSSYRETAASNSGNRPAGFLPEAMWREALAAAGFRHIEVLPSKLAACVELYPGFYSAAITAR
jgi:SAM-dependent methyltransferase